MTESTVPFTSTEVPQGYLLTASLTYQWDVATLEWIKGTQPAGGGGGAVTIADGADVAQGAKADAAWVAGDGTVVAILKAIAGGVGGGLTDTELRATPVPVSGTLTVNTGLTDVQLRATPVPVSGALTDTELRATPVPVSGTLTVNTGLTDVQLRATPVPVSGTVTANTGLSQPLTDAELRATPVPVSGTLVANPTGYVVRLDEASSTITYVGQAVPGTATSAASWSIKRLDSTSGLIVLWGGGTAAFTQIWDNRAALAYS